MMNLIDYASSSSGNLYELTDGKASLLIECGLPIREIRRIAGNPTRFQGCLVSHEHGDHAKAIQDITRIMPVLCSAGTAEATGIATGMKDGWNQIGDFQVCSFQTRHDAAEPVGFYIVGPSSGESLLFATDTYLIPVRSKATIFAVECNYIDRVLSANVEAGRIPTLVQERTLRSHMSLRNLIRYFRRCDLSNTREIVLLHLSDGNSDEKLMIEAVEAETGVPTRAGKKQTKEEG